MSETSQPLGEVFWITGLSGAGKTTLGTLLADRLEQLGRRTLKLDGDQLRDALGGNFGYDEASRRAAALCYSRLCLLLANQGFDVVCSTISLYHEVHTWNRLHFKNYWEILIQSPRELLELRSNKQVYNQKETDVVGIALEPEWPIEPHLVLDNDKDVKMEDLLKTVCEVCKI